MEHFRFDEFLATPKYDNDFKALVIRSVLELCADRVKDFPGMLAIGGEYKFILSFPSQAIPLPKRTEILVKAFYTFNEDEELALKLFDTMQAACDGKKVEHTECAFLDISRHT